MSPGEFDGLGALFERFLGIKQQQSQTKDSQKSAQKLIELSVFFSESSVTQSHADEHSRAS